MGYSACVCPRGSASNRLGDRGGCLAAAFGCAVLFQLVDEGLQTDAEDLGGSSLVVLCVLKRELDKGLLGFADRRTDLQADGVGLVCFRHRASADACTEVARQV